MSWFEKIKLRLCSKVSVDEQEHVSLERRLTGRRVIFVMLGILALALGLRLVNIQTEKYWSDELLSLDITTAFDTIGETVEYVKQVEFHPPLYYVLLRGWIAVFGEAEAATRSLSLLFGLGQIVLVYFFGRDLFGKKSVGVVAAFIVAILPVSVEFGQEARPYALVFFAATLAAWSLWRLMRQESSWRWAVVYLLASVFGMYLSYSYILALTVITGWWIVEIIAADRSSRLRHLRTFLLVNAGLFLAFYPWLEAFLRKLLLSQFYIFDLGRRNLPTRDVGFAAAVVDRLIWTTKLDFYEQYNIVLQVSAKFILLVSSLFWAARNADKFRNRSEIWPYAYMSWLACCLLIVFVASPLSTPYSALFIRHIIFFVVPVSLLVAAILVSLGRRGLFIGLFLAVTLVPPLGQVLADDTQWDYDHRFGIIGEYITENLQSGDVVVIYISTLRTDMSHYLPDDVPVLALEPLHYYGLDEWRTRKTLGLIENELQVRVGGPNDQGSGARDGSFPTPEAFERKLEYIAKEYEPKRIWFVGLTDGYSDVRTTLKKWGWRRSFRSLGILFPVDLYENPNYAIQE